MLESKTYPSYDSCWILEAQSWMRSAPAIAATRMGVPARKICRFGRVSLPNVSYNRNRSTPMARSRFRDDNCAVHEHLSPTGDQNIFPNRDALLPMADRKNKFPPNPPRPRHSRVPSACRISTHRPRSIRDQECNLRSPWPEHPRDQILSGPLPDNASQNLHAHQPPVIPSAFEESLTSFPTLVQRFLDFARHDN